MFKFGDKVIILDEALKSYKKIGLYCRNSNGLAKIYLKEPVGNQKSQVYCITIAEEKIGLYCEDNKETIMARLDYIYKRLNDISQEVVNLKAEAFKLEHEFIKD
jgi:hypothetical protein